MLRRHFAQVPLELTHEHVLRLLLTLVQHSQGARREANDPALGICLCLCMFVFVLMCLGVFVCLSV